MFLSLPVFQDPAPWNVVWRAGELFPIDVGDGTTLEEFAEKAPQRVCTRTFSLGDVIWKCRTCQVGDDTCVVCQACFQDGDHEGHDVSFYISRQESPALAPGTHHCSHFFLPHLTVHAACGFCHPLP